MRIVKTRISALLLTLAAANSLWAVVMSANEGKWPANWPAELEPFCKPMTHSISTQA
jgi:hypothetical protein